MENTDQVTLETKHAFSWHGPAPYKVVRSFVSKFQACPGAPIQPGTSCDHCSTAIMNVFVVRCGNGHEFNVGSDCVARAADPALIKSVNLIERKAAATKRAAKSVSVAAELTELIAANSAALASMPHPKDWAAAKGETMLDHAQWMNTRCGASGRAKLLKAIKAALECQ